MKLENAPALSELAPKLDHFFQLAEGKIALLDRSWDPAQGTPVFTVGGKYTTRGWTEWTQGFQYGCQVLHFDATGSSEMLQKGRDNTRKHMASHVTHIGVHDHGFNNISTYGNLRRLALEGRFDCDSSEIDFYELALKASGAVQAARWTELRSDNGRSAGFVHSFNGAHSLFSDTIRSMRSLLLAWQLGHSLLSENDQQISLLTRAIEHGRTTARYNVYYGEGRDVFDVPAESGRVVHESIFNVKDGRYRCPSTQQGYSPFSTWTRGLAWILAGYSEQLGFLASLDERDLEPCGPKQELLNAWLRAAQATADWYIKHSHADGMVYWDHGAPGLAAGVDLEAASDPLGGSEPIDSSAGAIAAQGMLRLADYLSGEQSGLAQRYESAARLIANTLFERPYLSESPDHQGFVLHSIYHRPNGWDHVPEGSKIPSGESSLWGDYHALELALLLKRRLEGERLPVFFDSQ